MANSKITSEVDDHVWAELHQLAVATNRSVPDLVTEAIRDYVRQAERHRAVHGHLERSIADNRRLGELLGK